MKRNKRKTPKFTQISEVKSRYKMVQTSVDKKHLIFDDEIVGTLEYSCEGDWIGKLGYTFVFDGHPYQAELIMPLLDYLKVSFAKFIGTDILISICMNRFAYFTESGSVVTGPSSELVDTFPDYVLKSHLCKPHFEYWLGQKGVSWR